MTAVQLLLLLVCSFQVIFSAPNQPQLSASFNANLKVTVTDKYGVHVGAGVWGVDQPNGKSVESYKFGGNYYDVFNLERYDIGKEFQLLNPNASNADCHEFAVTGTLPQTWSWVALSKYVSTDKGVDIWESSIGYAVLRLGVLSSDPTTPVYLTRQSRDERNSTYTFTTWSPTAPLSTLFAVPSVCTTLPKVDQPTACITRADIIARAKVWVADKVPYNQGGTFQGYREDCSGYVSMAWASSQPGHVTQTFDQISHPITKAELLEGDCLLYAAEHVVLFAGWTSSAQTEYVAYEETKPGEGTVTRPTPYPYWYDQADFKPYRFNNVCA